MVQETVQDAPAIPVDAPAGEPSAPPAEPKAEDKPEEGAAPPEGEDGAAGEPEASEPPPFSPDEWASNPDPEALPAPLKEWFEEQASEAKRTGIIEGMSQVQMRQQQFAQTRDEVIEGIQSVNEWLKQITESGKGLDGATWGRILERHAPALNQIPQILAESTVSQTAATASALSIASLMATAAQTYEAPELQKFAERLVEPTGQRDAQGNPTFGPSREFLYDKGQAAAQKFLKELKKHWDKTEGDKHFQRGVKAGRDGTVEASRTERRAGEAPPKGTGSASASGIRSMDDADRRYNLPQGHPEHITHDEYSEARKRFGVGA